MWNILQRYLAVNFIAPFLLSSFFFVVFLLTFQLFRIIRMIINKGVELVFVLELMGHIAISFIPMALPLSALLATIFVLNKLSEDSEIIAMRSFGINKFQILMPFMVLGLLISLAAYSLGRNLIPHSKRSFRNAVVQMTSKGLLADIKPEKFFIDIPNVILFAEKVKNKGDFLENVYIYLKGKEGPKEEKDEEKVIFAKEGRLIKEKKNRMDISSVRMFLVDGIITKINKQNNDMEKLFFKEYDFPIMSVEDGPQFVTKDDMRTSTELLEVIRRNDIEGKKDKSAIKSKLEYFSRINTPLLCMIFIFLGIGLGVREGRTSSPNTGMIGILILILYYVLFFGGISFAKKGVLPAELAVFAPSLVIFIISLRNYHKLDWIG